MRLVRTPQDPPILTPAEVEALLARLAAACARLPVALLYLHGSYAKGTPGPLSDLDLALLLDPEAERNPDTFLHVLGELIGHCGRDDVDLVSLGTAGAAIKDRVVRAGRLVYARSAAERIRFEAAVIKEAIDFRRFSAVYDDALLAQLAGGRVT